MEQISLNGKVVGFAEKSKDVKNFLPEGAPINISMIGGSDRELTYDDDVYTIEKSDKVVGTSEGDVCSLCHIGTLQNQGGCFTCNKCGAQLKCGL